MWKTVGSVLGVMLISALIGGLGWMVGKEEGAYEQLPPAVKAQKEAFVTQLGTLECGDIVVADSGDVEFVDHASDGQIWFVGKPKSRLYSSIITTSKKVKRIVLLDDPAWVEIARNHFRSQRDAASH